MKNHSLVQQRHHMVGEPHFKCTFNRLELNVTGSVRYKINHLSITIQTITFIKKNAVIQKLLHAFI